MDIFKIGGFISISTDTSMKNLTLATVTTDLNRAGTPKKFLIADYPGNLMFCWMLSDIIVPMWTVRYKS